MSTPKMGLTKPQLLALPKPKAPQAPSQTEDYFFSMSARVEKIGKATIVHAGLFWVKTRELIAEIFINPQELRDVTYNVTLNRWSKAQLGDYISNNIPDDNRSRWINRYYQSYRNTTYNEPIPPEVYKALDIGAGDTRPLVVVIEQQQRFNRMEVCRKRHEEKQRVIDTIMEQAKPFSKGFIKFIERTFRREHTYLLYEKKDKKSDVTLCCSWCGEDIQLPSAKVGHGRAAVCPNCHTNAECVCTGKLKYNKKDEEHILLPDRIHGGLLLRDIRVRQITFLKNGERKFEYMEAARTFCDLRTLGLTCYEEVWDSDRNGYKWRVEHQKSYWQYDAFRKGFVYTTPLKNALKNTEFRYCGIEIVAAAKQCTDLHIGRYLEQWRREPRIEYLAKIGLLNLCYELGCSGTHLEVFITDSKNILKALGITKTELLLLKQLNPSRREMERYNDLKAVVSPEQAIILLKKLQKLKVGADVLTSRTVALPPKVLTRLIMTYADEQSKIGALPSNLIRDYPDYYKELVLLGRDLRDTSNLFPNRFRERHTQLSAELSIKKDKITSKAVASRYTAERGLYEHKGKEYAVLMPRSAKEIALEGKTLGHCVATYAERHASSETTILFLREQADIKRPFATAEVRNGRLIQLRTTRNGAPPDTARKFFERYIERVLIPRLNKIDEERKHA